jgi:hypothetical protein
MAKIIVLQNVCDKTGHLKRADVITECGDNEGMLRLFPADGGTQIMVLESGDRLLASQHLDLNRTRALRDVLTRILDETHERLLIATQEKK